MRTTILYKDEKAISQIMGNAEKATEILNDFIAEAERECKTEFNPEQKIKIKDNGSLFLREWVKEIYPFPNATDKFNEDSLGLNITGLINQYNQTVHKFNNFDFKLKENGKFELNGSPGEIEKHIYKTETLRQAKAFKLSKEICDLLNEANEQGFINNSVLFDLREKSNLFDIEGQGEENKLIPNPYRIAKFIEKEHLK